MPGIILAPDVGKLDNKLPTNLGMLFLSVLTNYFELNIYDQTSTRTYEVA